MELIVHQPGKTQLQFLSENDQDLQNKFFVLNSLLRFGPKYGRNNHRTEIPGRKSPFCGHLRSKWLYHFLRQAFGKIVMSNKGAGQGQNGVLSHRDDTEWKMTDSNKRIRFYFSVARIFEKGHFNTFDVKYKINV